MKISKFFLATIGTLAFCCAGSSPAAAEVLYSGAGFLRGNQSFSDSFYVSSPGTLTVTLTNIPWPQQLASLKLLVDSTGGLLKSGDASSSPFSSSFSIGAGDVFAQWFGTAQGGFDIGVYSLKISFQPLQGGGNPVPLPTSIALFLSGLGLLLWHRRIRSESEPPAEAYRSSRDMQAA